MSHHHHHGDGCGHEHDDDDHIKPGEVRLFHLMSIDYSSLTLALLLLLLQGQQDFLYTRIDRDGVTCMNEQIAGMSIKTIKPYDKRNDESDYLESDADDQLIIRIPFIGGVKLRSLMIKSSPADQTPSEIHVFSNWETLDFDEVNNGTVQATQKLQSIAVAREVVTYPLKTAKFNNVRFITLFIPASLGGDTSRIYFIGFKGEWLGNQQREGPSNIVYESAPQVKDHAKIPGTESGTQSFGPGS